MHNYIQKDRYKPTVYRRKGLAGYQGQSRIHGKVAVSTMYPRCIKVEAQVIDRLGKDRLEIGKDSTKVDKPRFAPPALNEVKAYCAERKNTVDLNTGIPYETNGWMVGRNKMKD